jgi:hypothetical protein
MSKRSQPIGNKDQSALTPEILEKIENYLKKLTPEKESEAFEPKALIQLAGELDENPRGAEWLFQKILSQPTQRSSRILSALINQVTSRPVQKGIKRTLYLLKQKGIDFPSGLEKKEEKEGRGILKALEPVQVTGYLSEFDPARNRMVAMLIPKGTKGKVFMFALIEPEGSLGHLTALEVSKKEAKEILGDLAEQSGHSFLEADPGQVAFLLKEAHDRKPNLFAEDEGIYSAILSYLGGSKTLTPLPIIRSLFPGPEESREFSLDMTRLQSIPEVQYYQLQDEWIKPYQQAIQDVQTSVLILNPMQKREQIIGIIHRAGREIFQERVKTDLRRYLEEVSYLYYLKERDEETRVCFAAARSLAIEKEEENLEENPLLFWLTERALVGDQMREQQGGFAEQKEEQSEGGIIIPPWVKK